MDRDQRIGPVVHLDGAAQDGYGDWVQDPTRTYLNCKKEQVTKFKAPRIDYDIAIDIEFGRPSLMAPSPAFGPASGR